MKREAVAHALQAVLDRSPYFPFFFRNATRFGLSLGRDGMLVNMDFASDAVEFEYVADVKREEPPLWVETSERDLLAFAQHDTLMRNLAVRSPASVLPPPMERLLMRVFSPVASKAPAGEREDVIYGSLFGFDEPAEQWLSKDQSVSVLAYRGAMDGRHAFVSSGLSAPEMGPPAFEYEGDDLSGFGYELVVLSEEWDGVLREHFIDWVRRVHETKDHILRGNWLEYEGGAMPGTGMGGFLVVPPTKFPDEFPAGQGRIAWWNLLLPATAAEIEAAKREGGMTVAQQIFEAGFEDWSPLSRPSLV